VRAYPITTLKGGINRLRVKGGASADSLYDLQNAWIDNAGSVQPREGTLRTATLDSSTVGLAAANGKFNIFSSSFSTATLPTNYILNVLSNPNNTTASPTIIWYAKPFMGFLYVVAQFSDNSIFHYWLQNSGTWTSSTDYTSASIVLPPTLNGIAYQGVRDFPQQSLWTPETIITSGSYVEPNTATGFAYQAVATTGSPVHTGAVEPVWPTVAGGIIQEFGDFDLSSSDAGTTQASLNGISTASPLGSNITDRYGNSNTVSNAGIFATSSTLSTLTLASTKVTTWAAGTNYAPGAVVIPTSNQGAFVNAIPNGDFEGGSGAGGWTFTDPGGVSQWAYSSTLPYQGSECISIPGGAGIGAGGAFATMTSYSLVTPGQSVTASAYLDPNNNGADLTLWIQLNWYDHSDSIISSSGHGQNLQEGGGYRKASITATAPSGAAHVRVSIGAGSGTNSRNGGNADLVTWNLEQAAPITNFLFEAVQPSAGSSAATEPTWPTVLGNEVIDGSVTWKAIGTSIITWQAIPLMQSGLVAPTFPTIVGNAVNDSSTYTNINGYTTTFSGMSWVAVDRHIADSKCPNTIAVAIGASHVFAGDNDITDYSAAVDPTDWTSSNNAGYLPTGLNSYGDNPVAMLALYRGNLMAFNAGGYQMWQIDPDPQNMAFLDAQPIGSIWSRSGQSVANNLLFLTEVGVRDLGTLGATANMAIGNTGQPVDPLVQAQLVTGTFTSTSQYPLSLYYPGRGQYWLIFGSMALVLTINGNSQKSWSRYFFPQAITDWTLNAGVLYLRTAGNLVWALNAATLGDDSNVNASPQTVLLLHFDGTNGQTTTVDSSQYNNAVTFNNASGVMLTTSNPKFGTASMVAPFYNALGSYVTNISCATGSRCEIFNKPNWTIECWVNVTYLSIGSPSTIFTYGDSLTSRHALQASIIFQSSSTATIQVTDFQAFNTNITLDANNTPATINTWHHFALVNNGDATQTVYWDGTAVVFTSNWTSANAHNGSDTFIDIGAFAWYSGSNIPSQIDEFRVSTAAIYTSNFVPPTAPFTVSSQTAFNGLMQWPYLDLGALALNKMMIGLDIVGAGDCNVQVAFNQGDPSTFNDNVNFATSTGVTSPYFVAIDDTVPGTPIPIPAMAPSYSVILTFPGGTLTTPNAWAWQASNIYIADASGAGGMS
jgi:hypothetical protein